MAYDGGTDLTSLDFSKPTHTDMVAWLLFSNGMGTVVNGLPQLAQTKVFTISSAPAYNASLFQYIAHQTGGDGPEEYVLKKAILGEYVIKAHYYGSSQQRVCGPYTVIATIFTDYGRKNEQKQVLTLRLDKPSDQVQVGSINIAGKEARVDLI